MGLDFREVEVAKGMILRGDRQHDIAAYFGVNGGRIGEVANGEGPYPNARARPVEKLPPAGPYLTKYALESVVRTLNEAIEAIELAESGETLEDVKVALELAKETLLKKIDELEEV